MKLSAALVLVAVLVTSGTVARVARRQSGGCVWVGKLQNVQIEASVDLID